MIAKLRRRHRYAAFSLWLLLPAALFLYFAAVPAPRMAELPAVLRKALPSNAEIEWRHTDAATGIEIGTATSGASKGALALRPAVPLRRPDVLVYWLAAQPEPGEGVPDGAIFAGRLDGARPVAVATPSESGGLLLFSLGHQERLGWIALGDVP